MVKVKLFQAQFGLEVSQFGDAIDLYAMLNLKFLDHYSPFLLPLPNKFQIPLSRSPRIFITK